MVHILLIQGAGVGGSDSLVADVSRQLGQDESIEAPVMPLADDPAAARWLPAVAAALAEQDGPFVAVGHSLGGSTLLQWLAANPAPPHLRAVITAAAPFWGEGGWSMAEFALPAGAAAGLAGIPCLMLNGDVDDTVPPDHLDLYRAQLPHVETAIIPGMDHEWARGGFALLDAVRRYA